MTNASNVRPTCEKILGKRDSWSINEGNLKEICEYLMFEFI
jgi:hypothetical protein